MDDIRKLEIDAGWAIGYRVRTLPPTATAPHGYKQLVSPDGKVRRTVPIPANGDFDPYEDLLCGGMPHFARTPAATLEALERVGILANYECVAENTLYGASHTYEVHVIPPIEERSGMTPWVVQVGYAASAVEPWVVIIHQTGETLGVALCRAIVVLHPSPSTEPEEGV